MRISLVSEMCVYNLTLSLNKVAVAVCLSGVSSLYSQNNAEFVRMVQLKCYAATWLHVENDHFP